MKPAQPVVLITGGSCGIGAELARELSSRGATLVLTDIDADTLQVTATTIDGPCLPIVADVRDPDAMTSAVESAVSAFGRIDVVVANAGIASYGSIANTDPRSFQRTLDTNVVGLFNTARSTFDALSHSKGYFLVISSLAAFMAAPGLSAYHASKAADEHFANVLNLEAAAAGVAVGCAHMSWIDTPLMQDARSDLPSFDTLLRSLPYPMNQIAPVQSRVSILSRGIERRARHIYAPGWVRLFNPGRHLTNSRIGAWITGRMTAGLLVGMDHDIAVVGRSVGERYDEPAGSAPRSLASSDTYRSTI